VGWAVDRVGHGQLSARYDHLAHGTEGLGTEAIVDHYVWLITATSA
jgi:hypothetical protein